MFDKEFFPTPKEVLGQMQIDCNNKIVLEPSAGKGDIVDFLKLNGAKSVLAFEKNQDLQKIVKEKCQLVGDDFLMCDSSQVSHVDLIVMNPPFSNADEHIMHAFNIAPEGCEIIALCNWETINNPYTRARKGFKSTIKDYGISNNLGAVFTQAERTTGIDIGLVKLFKPIVSGETEFEGFFMDEDEEEQQGEGIMQFNEVRALVQRYVGAMKVFDKLKSNMDELNYTISGLGMKDVKLNVGYNDDITNKDDFSKHIQKVSWNHIIDKTGIRKMTTSLMMEDINKFVETQTKYPFTMKNVYQMLDMIVQTRGQQFEKALVIAVDEFTRHVKENRYEVEGWSTNLGHMLNRKIIIPDLFQRGWGNADFVSVRVGSRYRNRLDDLTKVICSLIGFDYNTMNGYHLDYNGNKVNNYPGINGFKPVDGDRIRTGVWYDWGFFEFKCFYKGTMHLKFKNKDDWYRVNQAYAKAKGFVLPE